MSEVISNLNDMVELYVGLVRIDDDLQISWMNKNLLRELLSREAMRKKHDFFDFRNCSKHLEIAREKNEPIYFLDSTSLSGEELKNEVIFIFDWLAELEQRDPRLFSKLDRITWRQAIEHSRRWHQALARKADRLENGFIEFDDNCPVMHDHGNGWKWVWLKTPKARDDESDAMGHCVGKGGYENLSDREGVFSLRDVNGKPHVTMLLNVSGISQSVTKGNNKVPEKYSEMVQSFASEMRRRMNFSSIEKKLKKTEFSGLFKLWNDTERYYEKGLLHRVGGPAIMRLTGTREWYENGKKHREDGPAVERRDGKMEWWSHGKKHRNGGPAVYWTKRRDQEWWVDGQKHRDDGPAVIVGKREFHWYRNGRLHREDGPAIEHSYYPHSNRYFLNGVFFEKEDFDSLRSDTQNGVSIKN